MLLKKGKFTEEMIRMLSTGRHSGFNIFCGSRILPKDETSMENLTCYISRASFSQERMRYLKQEGTVIYKANDGKDTKIFPAMEWLAAMCSHIPNRGINKDKLLQSEVGALDSLLETLRAIARDAAQKLDEQDSAAVPLIVTFKELVAGFQLKISAAVAKWEIKAKERYNVLLTDINVLGALQEKTLQDKQAKPEDELLHGAR